jgi:inorganic pyrophosphatase
MSNVSIIDVRVEIPMGGRNKYEFDHDKKAFKLDRRLFSSAYDPYRKPVWDRLS